MAPWRAGLVCGAGEAAVAAWRAGLACGPGEPAHAAPISSNWSNWSNWSVELHKQPHKNTAGSSMFIGTESTL